MAPLQINVSACNYQALIGVGGIGAGRFFALNGNHTLGREESRAGRFLANRDYCKLHIIAHYVQKLLGAEFISILIGKVGDDSMGHQLLREMSRTGLDIRYVRASPGDPTLYSLCLVYPDGTGGNVTTDDSACTKVDADYVAQAEPEFARFRGHGIALAAPEVPLPAREKLLQLGTAYGFLRVASFVSAEIRSVLDTDLLGQIDLLAINLDEAAVVAQLPTDKTSAVSIVTTAVEKLVAINPGLSISITAGKQGSWGWDGKAFTQGPVFPVEAVSTAGAGDAHLAGLIVGLTAGLTLAQAQELAALIAALSVTSPHTIHPELERETLNIFATEFSIPLPVEVKYLLESYNLLNARVIARNNLPASQ
jgi:ribokinase